MCNAVTFASFQGAGSLPSSKDFVNIKYKGVTTPSLLNNVETLMYVLIEFIFCLGIPKTPTQEAPEGMEPCYFHRRIHAFKQLKTL